MSNKLFVGNLPFNADETVLEGLFSEFGEIVSTKVIRDRDTGRSKGFGFVEYSSEDPVKPAIEACNGKEVEGRSIKVDEAKPQENSGRGGGGRGGYGGGGGGRGGRGGRGGGGGYGGGYGGGGRGRR